jgi:DNA-binding response OmpR family regulator
MNKVMLLVDDDDSLSKFIKICVEESGSLMEVRQVASVDKAMDYLQNKGEFADKRSNPDPHVMLLDLGLPKTSGIDFLKQLKNKKEYADMPIVILTAMESTENIRNAYYNYANSCLIKPFGFEKTKELMKSVTSYWGKYNRLPDRAV